MHHAGLRAIEELRLIRDLVLDGVRDCLLRTQPALNAVDYAPARAVLEGRDLDRPERASAVFGPPISPKEP